MNSSPHVRISRTPTRPPRVLSGGPWLVSCPCCRTKAAFHKWNRALHYAIGHVNAEHRNPPEVNTP